MNSLSRGQAQRRGGGIDVGINALEPDNGFMARTSPPAAKNTHMTPTRTAASYGNVSDLPCFRLSDTCK